MMNKTAGWISLFLTALGIGAVTVFAAPAAGPQGPSELIADTLTYDMKNDVMIAQGNVVMITTDGKATGDYAEYHNRDKSGKVVGRVIADKGDIHMECDEFYVDGQTHFTAVGNVKRTAGQDLHRSQGGILSGQELCDDGAGRHRHQQGWQPDCRLHGGLAGGGAFCGPGQLPYRQPAEEF